MHIVWRYDHAVRARVASTSHECCTAASQTCVSRDEISRATMTVRPSCGYLDPARSTRLLLLPKTAMGWVLAIDTEYKKNGCHVKMYAKTVAPWALPSASVAVIAEFVLLPQRYAAWSYKVSADFLPFGVFLFLCIRKKYEASLLPKQQ